MKNGTTMVLMLATAFGVYCIKLITACSSPLGMENGTIKDEQITSGGSISNDSPVEARYNGANAWCTLGGADYDNGQFNSNYFLQIDLHVDHTIAAIVLQGLKNSLSFSYGSKIRVQWRSNASNIFGYYKDSKGNVDLQTNNLKNDSAETIYFKPPLCGRYLRLLPLVNANVKCIRLEVLGCIGCYGEVTTLQPSTPTTIVSIQSSQAVPTSLLPSKKSTQHTTVTKAPSDPSEKKEDSKTILIVAIVLGVVCLVIVGVLVYRFRSRLCFKYGDSNSNHKGQKSTKLDFHVSIEATYSTVKAKDEPERLSLLMLEDQQTNNDYQYSEVYVEGQSSQYSEVYAAPTINRNGPSKIAPNADSTSSSTPKSGLEGIYEPTVKYSEPDANNKNSNNYNREPIYAGSKIYENPYQAVTGSSLYANPDIIEKKGLINVPEFPHKKLTFLEQIGEGQFGEVHICEVENLSALVGDVKRFSQVFGRVTKVAVKMLKKGQESSVEEEFMKEARVMARLEHENVVQLIGVCYEEPKCIVVEYMENGDLMQFLQTSSGRSNTDGDLTRINEVTGDLLTNEALYYIAMQIAAGMDYLSKEGFVHRDLATRNCLVGHALTVKIADFGMSRYLYSKLYYRIEGMATLPIRWMAPESLYYGTFTSPTDVWAFAVTVWEILTFAAEQPFNHLSDQQVLENALSVMGESRKAFEYLSQPATCPGEVFSLLMRCWKRSPEERPTFHEIFKYFKEICNVSEGDI